MSSEPKPLSDEALSALNAIYRDAFHRGYAEGFRSGVEEKAWLHKHWPLLGSCLCAAGIFGGLLIGVSN